MQYTHLARFAFLDASLISCFGALFDLFCVYLFAWRGDEEPHQKNKTEKKQARQHSKISTVHQETSDSGYAEIGPAGKCRSIDAMYI